MGNQMSVPQRLEDQENELETDTHKVMPESECHQNGMLVVSQSHPVQQYDEVLEGEKSNIKGPADSSSVDSGTSVREDNAATASPTTMEISAVADASGKNLGKEAKPEAPAARSRFFLTLSRPVPGRAGDQATDSSTGSVKLDVSSNQAPRNKDPSEPGALPRAAAPGRDPDKTPGPTPAAQLGLSATWGPESGGAAPSKPKDPSFFDKLFKLDKEREQTPVDSQQEAKCAQHQDQARETPGSSTQSSDVPAEGDIADGRRREGQEITTVSCSVPGDPEELAPAKEGPQTENNNSIMSFFKTLVSPSKAETKKDPEDTASKAESVCDGQAGQKTAESQAKGAKKKHLHSPQLGLAFRKFFRHKGAEKSPTTPADIKPDKGHVTPQEPQGAAKNSTSTEAAKEGAKEKGGPTSLPLGKLFWKKSVKEDSVPTGAEENVVCESAVEVKSEEVDSALHTVDLSEEGASAPEPAEVTPKREERKAQRPSLMAFLRQMSVKGDGGTTHSEEINGKDSSYQTPESPEKAVAPPEPEPAAAAQKGKDGPSKDKKAAAEPSKQRNGKQEAKEPAPSAAPAAAEASSLQNGDKSQRRPEKRRQSLGGFFKGLGPKRMSDAQVQTDPVSIGPVGKSK